MSDLRVAVFSDVHGNLQALDTTLAELERRGPWQRIVAAGDHCLSGPEPETTLARVLETASDVLKGNTDRDIVDSGASDPELGDKKRAAIVWTREQLGARGIKTLDQLPFEARVTAPDGSSLVIVHANPCDLDQHIFPDMPLAELRPLIDGLDADILAFGHLHIPFRRTVGKLRLFNLAACGSPRDGDRRAAWGEFSWQAGRGWRGYIHRVAYDYGETVLRMLSSGMPNPDKRIRDLLRATYA
jgi:predicted phosphodiesterase